MEQTISPEASREIPCILWNPKVYYCVYDNQPLVLPHSKPDEPISRSSTTRSAKWYIVFTFPHPTHV